MGDVWAFNKPEGTLLLTVVEVGASTVRYETRWEPPSIARPRLVDPVLREDWRRWRKRGRRVVASEPRLFT